MKKKIIYASFAIVLMLLGVAVINQPKHITQVFASQVEQESVNTKTITSDVGTITGEGFYMAGETASLSITLNPGYTFLGWYEAGTENKLSELSEYTFTVSQNINIEARYKLTDYQISLHSDLSDDFTITNKKVKLDASGNFDKNEIEYEETAINYQNIVEVVIERNSLLIYDLNNENFTINGEILTDYFTDNTDVLVDDYEIVNDLGFESIKMYLKITEDMEFNIDYKYINKFIIKSSSSSTVEIASVINLIEVTGDLYSKSDKQGKYDETSAGYVYYMVQSSKGVGGTINIKLGSDDVYNFVETSIEGVPSIENSQMYQVNNNNVVYYYVKYEKISYNIVFEALIYNSNETLEWNTIFNEDFGSVTLTAGDRITVEATISSNILQALKISSTQYTIKSNVYGYAFYGFGIDGNYHGGTKINVEMDSTNPNDMMVQIYFQYRTYDPTIRLVYNNVEDSYFDSRIVKTISYEGNLHIGSQIELSATSSVCDIIGWKNSPSSNIYISRDNPYSFIFNPTSNDLNVIYYLEVDYKDYDFTFKLTNTSYEEITYDEVAVNYTTKYITFKDTSNKVDPIEFDYSDYVTIDGSTMEIVNPDYPTLGTITINDKLKVSYGFPVRESIGRINSGDIYTYEFKKYNPYAQLEVGVVTYLQIESTVDGDQVNIYGDIYSNMFAAKDNQLLHTVVINKNDYEQTPIDGVNYIKYNLSNELIVYYNTMEGYGYWYVDYKDVRFTKDGDGLFKPAKSDEVQMAGSYTELGFTIHKVHYDQILLLISSNKSLTSYKYEGHVLNGGSLGSYEIDRTITINGKTISTKANISTLSINETCEVEAQYSLITYMFKVRIDNTNAYLPRNIYVFIDGEAVIKTADMQFSGVEDNSNVSIRIDPKYIQAGYKYSGAYINDDQKTNDREFVFNMSEEYHEQIIELRFAPITYSISLNVQDDKGQEASDNVECILINSTTSEPLNNWWLTIENSYTITAGAIAGHYISQAYFKLDGKDRFNLDLCGDNNDGNSNKTIYINAGQDFIEYIINNADTNYKVNLYLIVSIDYLELTLTYFTDANNLLELEFPNIYYIISDDNEIEGTDEWQTANDLNVYSNQTIIYNYGQYIAFKYDNLITGFKSVKFAFYSGQNISADANGVAVSGQLTTNNLTCTVTIELVEYNIKFKRLFKDQDYDESKAKNYGSVNGTTKATILDIIEFAVTPNGGYKFNRAYYNTATGECDVESGFKFIPVNEAITTGPDFNIFIEFINSQINLTVTNNFAELESEFNVPSIATQEITLNGNVVTDPIFLVQMGDVVGVKILTPYKGLAVQSVLKVKTGDTKYELTTNKVDGGYEHSFELKLDNATIIKLEDNTTLNNELIKREYTVNYGYNFIDNDLGIKLKVNKELDNGETEEITLNPDVKYTGNITFGANIKFYYDQNTDLDFIGYEVKGNSQTGLVNEVEKYLSIDSLEDWNIVLNLLTDTTMTVNLIIGPQITLQGGVEDENLYIFTSIYNGQVQTIADAHGYVQVPGISSDNITITYTLGGEDVLPKNVGEYQVNIVVNYYDQEFIYGVYGEGSDRNIRVRLIITPKEISASMSNNKISKTYDGTNLINDVITAGWKSNLILNGLCGNDGESVSINFNTLFAYYNSNQVGDNIAIIIENLEIVGTNELVNNYNLKVSIRMEEDGSEIVYQVFEGAGVITKRALTISGVRVSDKVYDGNGEVVANVDNLTFSNLIGTDNIDKNKLKFTCQDFEIGRNKIVSLDYSQAVSAEIINNYNINYIPVDIDIYPNKLEREIYGVGIFTLEDRDNLCFIPFDSQLSVSVYSREHELYREIYPKIEPLMSSGDRFQVCYEFALRVGEVSQSIKAGLYLTFPDTVKLTSILTSTGDNYNKAEFNKVDNITVIKLNSTELNPKVCCIRDVEFMPLWLIITIIASGVGVIGLGVLIFIIIRRRREAKLMARDKI